MHLSIRSPGVNLSTKHKIQKGFTDYLGHIRHTGGKGEFWPVEMAQRIKALDTKRLEFRIQNTAGRRRAPFLAACPDDYTHTLACAQERVQGHKHPH